MIGNDIAIAVREIATTIGVASSEIIPHYVTYYITSSIAFMLLGVVLCVIAVFVYKKIAYDEEIITATLIGAFLGVIGVWVFFYYAGDLFGAQGMAIHQLIIDIRGK